MKELYPRRRQNKLEAIRECGISIPALISVVSKGKDAEEGRVMMKPAVGALEGEQTWTEGLCWPPSCPSLALQLNLLCSYGCSCAEQTSLVQIKRTRCSEVANSHIGVFFSSLFVFLAHESKFRFLGVGQPNLGVGGSCSKKYFRTQRAECNVSKQLVSEALN